VDAFSASMGRTRAAAIHRTAYQFLLARLRTARLAANLTQVEVAETLNRPKSYVSKCELGERRIDPIDLQEFAALYGKPLSYFLPRGAALPAKRDRK
jgi:transcriptional regulator with XRE-family HTH domain